MSNSGISHIGTDLYVCIFAPSIQSHEKHLHMFRESAEFGSYVKVWYLCPEDMEEKQRKEAGGGL